jgi:hypothetical protein
VGTICLSDQAVLKPILRGKKRYSRETRKRFSTHIWSPGLAFFRAVDPAEADAFRKLVVQDFERVPVEDGDDGAMILRDSDSRSGCQEGEEHTERPDREATVGAKGEWHRGLAERRIVGGMRTRAQGLQARPSRASGKMVVWYRRHPFTKNCI